MRVWVKRAPIPEAGGRGRWGYTPNHTLITPPLDSVTKHGDGYVREMGFP